MDVGKYRAVTKPVVVDLDGEIINATYRPNIYTISFERQLEAVTDDTDQAARLFIELVASWDLYDGDAVVPLTVEAVEEIPLEILTAILSSVRGELTPSEEEKRGSSEPLDSAQADSTPPSTSSSESAQTSSNGSETSASPTVSESVPST